MACALPAFTLLNMKLWITIQALLGECWVLVTHSKPLWLCGCWRPCFVQEVDDVAGCCIPVICYNSSTKRKKTTVHGPNKFMTTVKIRTVTSRHISELQKLRISMELQQIRSFIDWHRFVYWRLSIHSDPLSFLIILLLQFFFFSCIPLHLFLLCKYITIVTVYPVRVRGLEWYRTVDETISEKKKRFEESKVSGVSYTQSNIVGHRQRINILFQFELLTGTEPANIKERKPNHQCMSVDDNTRQFVSCTYQSTDRYRPRC